VEEMRGELERLMADLRLAKMQVAPTVSPLAAGSRVQCALPAAVPALPTGLRVTIEMESLLLRLLSSTTAAQVGFCGMGGIGKTTISTWLIRTAAVREKFQQMVWVTMGQTPNIPKLQAISYLQLTGVEADKNWSEQELVQHLKQAYVGKSVLLVLDDAWEKDALGLLSFIDEATPSKLLISSRVQNVLEGGEILNLSVPSDADAVQMLINEAGFACTDGSSGMHVTPPPEALEVVKFCNNLPLAIGIAGSLLKHMSLGSDWSEVLAVLREEFGEGGQVRSMENSVIRTSLKSIKGRHREQVIQLLCGFALVPEDTYCPLEVISMIFEATTPKPTSAPGTMSEATLTVPRLLIRKWLKILIDRSLVLGTVDRPQLHVRFFVQFV
jgi:hypothetical protein